MPQELTSVTEHRETIERFREELGQAKTWYDGARAAYKQAQKPHKDPSAQPLAGATLEYDFAQRGYMNTLLRFNEFILNSR